ncbi:MAG: hypothetical protein HZA54_19400, partial [Planctomycetes bacterium]|nr:hypothetical protein [Planctomycetota bacterium]
EGRTAPAAPAPARAPADAAARRDQAAEWVARAIDYGWSDLAAMREDPELAGLRSHERFRKLVGLP